jgi:hypothetical protein
MSDPSRDAAYMDIHLDKHALHKQYHPFHSPWDSDKQENNVLDFSNM